MDIGAAAWLVILLALVLANLPFFNERILALVPLKSGAGQAASKPFLVRLLELTVLYFVVDKVMGLRPSVDAEREGLDLTEHGERAYNY